jgi:hypothetical protein
MFKPTEEDAVDEKIHRFLNRKAPWKTAGKLLSEQLTPTRSGTASSDSDISYELLDWQHTSVVRRANWQKAH